MRLLALLAILVSLCSCGTERTENSRLEEQEVYELSPMEVETPAGTFRTKKAALVRKRTQIQTSNETYEYKMPELAEYGSAVLGGLGGPLLGGGAVGLIASFLMRRAKAKFAEERDSLKDDLSTVTRHRDEIIRGVERSKSKLEKSQWDVLTENLERSQSQDTIKVVQEKTS